MSLFDDPHPKTEFQDAAEPILTPEPPRVVEAPVDDQTPTQELPVNDPPPAVEPPPITEPAPAEPPQPSGLLYTVQQGETLWGIAKKFGTTIDAVVQANTLEDRNNLRAGQKLIIPR